ncbi:unnamed protein product, partial [Ixodes persulcatus]
IPRLLGHFQGVRLCKPFAAMDGIGGVENACGMEGLSPRDIQRQQSCGVVGGGIHRAHKGHKGTETGVPTFTTSVHVVSCKTGERALEDSRLGFKMCYGEEGRQVDKRIPALIFADDVVLMAGSLEELQKSLDTCGEEGSTLGLMINPSKSGV